MSAKFDQIVKKISNSVKASQEKKTSAYDTTAKVLRVDGDIAWVHIPGGVDETPVRLTVNAEAGDEVQVRVGGGDAWLVGNGSAPPTDDKTANSARETATTADKKATTAKKSADEALDGVKKQREFFWHDDDGAHVLSDADGTTGTRYRTDVKGAGLEIFKVNQDGTEESVAKFGETTQIGKSYAQRVIMSGDRIAMYDSSGLKTYSIGKSSATRTAFVTEQVNIVSDESFSYQIKGEIAVDPSLPINLLTVTCAVWNGIQWSYSPAMYIYGTPSSESLLGWNISYDGDKTFTFTKQSGTNPARFDDAYYLTNVYEPVYEMGTNVEASTGSQTVLGKYNIKDSSGEHALIVGNGSSDSARSNALTVDWDGNVEASGGFTSPTLTQSYTSQYVANIYAEKWGKVVSITLNNMKSVPANSSVDLFTLPSGWRPNHVCMWLLRNPTDNYRLRVSINTAGVVSVYNYTTSALPTSSNATQTCTFITA